MKSVSESALDNDKFTNNIGERIFGILATLAAVGSNFVTILGYISKLVNKRCLETFIS